MKETKNITVWAIGDLHLSIGLDADKQKPMDLFGEQWVQHTAKIAHAWCAQVAADDIVLLVGDIFWGNRIDEAQFALNWLGCLPGRKVMVRGNHDNWWTSISKVRAALPAGMYAIQQDCVVLDGLAIAGTRGWTFNDPNGAAHQEKLQRRELARLQTSLAAMPPDVERRVVITHFPPFSDEGLVPEIAALLEAYGVAQCVFGHLHGQEAMDFAAIEKNSVKYVLASADYIDFSPVRLYNYRYNRDIVRNDCIND